MGVARRFNSLEKFKELLEVQSFQLDLDGIDREFVATSGD